MPPECRVYQWDISSPDALSRVLCALQKSSEQTLDDGSPPVFKSRRSDGDERRRWLVCRLAYLYEAQTGRAVSAYSDDGVRKGNSGSDFVMEAFFMLTGKKIPKSAVERFRRDERKRDHRPERPA
jgi:hypothetical protein